MKKLLLLIASSTLAITALSYLFQPVTINVYSTKVEVQKDIKAKTTTKEK